MRARRAPSCAGAMDAPFWVMIFVSCVWHRVARTLRRKATGTILLGRERVSAPSGPFFTRIFFPAPGLFFLGGGGLRGPLPNWRAGCKRYIDDWYSSFLDNATGDSSEPLPSPPTLRNFCWPKREMLSVFYGIVFL